MASIQCANIGSKIRLKRTCPDRAMANTRATIISHQRSDVGPICHSFIRCHWDETQNQAQEKCPDRAMANIQCACPEKQIRLKKRSPEGAIAKASATIIVNQHTDVGPI